MLLKNRSRQDDSTGRMEGSRQLGGTIFCLIGRSGDQTDGEATDAEATAGGCDKRQDAIEV